MAVKSSPTTLRRQLGAELRRLRDASGRTVADVARSLGWSESKLSRIETAHTGIRNRDLDLLLDTYSVPDDDRRRIQAVAVQSRQRAWWEGYRDVLPDAYEMLIGFESEAESLQCYEGLVVPGLLQTDEYARAVFESDGHRHDGRALGVSEIDQKVAVRMARQSLLTRQPPLDFVAILDEGVLHRQVGGPGVLRRQLIRLAETSERANVTIQVLPFSAGAHPALAGAFAILRFSGGQSPLVHCEVRTGGIFQTRAEEVEGYAASFDELRAIALSPEKSIDFLHTASREAGNR